MGLDDVESQASVPVRCTTRRMRSAARAPLAISEANATMAIEADKSCAAWRDDAIAGLRCKCCCLVEHQSCIPRRRFTRSRWERWRAMLQCGHRELAIFRGGERWNSAFSIISTVRPVARRILRGPPAHHRRRTIEPASTPIIWRSTLDAARHGAVAERIPLFGGATNAQAALRPAGLCAAALSSAAADRRNLHARSDERRPAGDRLRPRRGRRSSSSITAPIPPRRRRFTPNWSSW